ncbi:OmpL47-type beta-barrel domain-containing protein [Streptomyces poonensis]|uniref:Glycosyl hydrolase n=1 Tax=Streptomyces poonensis TaxID=68255 RepID=A0A918Q989_9ACTN|nr:family 16 glycoside hydrolase [Streptomyces poonensis]GGZ38628.1 glycosyl hydrolase [Streptomyces poonensis]GLJ92068.1 glycosyl hydrolase [Streptomyces poonensis]
MSSTMSRRYARPARPRRHLWTALLAALLMVLGLTSTAAFGRPLPVDEPIAAAQVLTWTADNDIDSYASAPQTAVAGATTIVFENSEATGNTTGMPHTLTFDVSDPEYNNDVSLNILANPFDDQGGRHTAEVTLTPGRYRYHCTIPGHGQMQGVLVVTEGTGDDTTAPETSAEVSGSQNADGAYVGSATVAVGATDPGGSGVERVEYAIGDGGAWQPYTTPVVVDQVGSHKVRYRAVDKAGNTAAEKSVEFTVVAPPTDDTAPPETSATVTGEQSAEGDYVAMATVTVSASDTGSGVNTIEYAIGDDGAWQPYTAPVMVHEVGAHVVRYRATDKAGNVSDAKNVAFTVVAPPVEDTTPPVTGATVEGERNSSGAYIKSAKVTVSATDEHGGSGVAAVEYSLDGGPYLAYTAPVVVDRVGAHSVAYRASDKAGNTAEARTVSFTVAAGGGVPAPACAEWDERLTVIVGTVDSGVPNRLTNNRCRINELIEDEKEWTSQQLFLKHVREVTEKLLKEGVIDQRELEAIRKAARQSGIGTPGQTEGYRSILDGTEESFARWQHVGGGSFGLNADGSITSGTSRGGLGMLWFPERKYGDFSLRLQWRDDAPGTANTNGGVFVRFPYVHDHPEESRPEWVAIKYGHEVQVHDRPDGDMYKTGSIYGFDRVGLAGAGVTEKGTWNDYEIRVVDQHYSVYRNGVLINEFDNTGGQEFYPARSDDPGTDGRRFASGYIGLQVHGTTDVVSYRDIRIMEL